MRRGIFDVCRYATPSIILSLVSISRNPDTAYNATVTFSDYLRGNMDSLKGAYQRLSG